VRVCVLFGLCVRGDFLFVCVLCAIFGVWCVCVLYMCVLFRVHVCVVFRASICVFWSSWLLFVCLCVLSTFAGVCIECTSNRVSVCVTNTIQLVTLTTAFAYPLWLFRRRKRFAAATAQQ